jgi:hypothetical protein
VESRIDDPGTTIHRLNDTELRSLRGAFLEALAGQHLRLHDVMASLAYFMTHNITAYGRGPFDDGVRLALYTDSDFDFDFIRRGQAPHRRPPIKRTARSISLGSRR